MKPFILSLACLFFLSCDKKTSVPPSGVINTVAEEATYGLATDNKGNFYFVNGRDVFKVDSKGTESIVAGCIDSEGFAGDGGPATKAALNYATKIAVDAEGNIYIADEGNNRVRKVNTAGIISTIAGTGTPAYTGDGGPATAAGINEPSGVAVDNSGNVFITEFKNHCVRKIDVSGTISTIAGNGTSGFGGDGGPAINAQLAEPAGVAIDKNGNIYVCDAWNHRIRKIDAGGTISTFAGNGLPYYYVDGLQATAVWICPSAFGGVCVDGDGNVYLVDASTMHIRKVNTAGIITNFAGNGYTMQHYGGHITGGYSGDGGPATDAKLDWVYDVAVDAIGNVYIADEGNLRVRKVNR